MNLTDAPGVPIGALPTLARVAPVVRIHTVLIVISRVRVGGG